MEWIFTATEVIFMKNFGLMKKILSVLVFAALIFLPENIFASDVWVTTEIYNDSDIYKTEYYLVTDYIDTKDERMMHRFDIILKRVFSSKTEIP